jgi:predicted rRNA methylase YqxC with S4 and FtsJ domains
MGIERSLMNKEREALIKWKQKMVEVRRMLEEPKAIQVNLSNLDECQDLLVKAVSFNLQKEVLEYIDEILETTK